MATKSIAERRREYAEAEKERLEEIERKIKLRNEFFNFEKPKIDKNDLRAPGVISGRFQINLTSPKIDRVTSADSFKLLPVKKFRPKLGRKSI